MDETVTQARLELDYADYVNRLKEHEPKATEVPKPTLADCEPFYDAYARLLERSNSFKVLYQVLVEEYGRLGILRDDEIAELREAAVAGLKARLIAGTWQSPTSFDEKAGFRDEVLAEVRARIHECARRRERDGRRIAALCLSGGGIRSATFGLGVIQALAKHNLLEQFDYLSTVSGGGYIGSWLSAWMHRVRKPDPDAEPAEPDPAAKFDNLGAVAVSQKLSTSTADQTEPPEVTHLRSYSNYMSPRTGMFSTDTWTLIAVYCRNLLLNWTVFVPILAVVLLLPRVFLDLVTIEIPDFVKFDFAVDIEVATITGRFTECAPIVAGAIAGVFAVMSANSMRPSLQPYSWFDHEFTGTEINTKKSVSFLVVLFAVVPVIVLAVCFSFARWIHRETVPFVFAAAIGVFVFVGGYLLTWINFLLFGAVRKWGRAAAPATPKNRHALDFPLELLYSFLAGAFGGAMLYAADNLMSAGARFARGHFGAAYDAPAYFVTVAPVLVTLVFLLSATLFVGLAVKITDDADREWSARYGAILLVLLVGWLIVATVVFWGPRVFGVDWYGLAVWFGGIASGGATLFSGFSKKTSSSNADPKSSSGMALTILAGVAAPAFVLFLGALVSFVTLQLTGSTVDYFGAANNLAWCVLLALLGTGMGFAININKFSIHAIYRERLIRAYLGASRTLKRILTVNSFTGLDGERDNIELKYLRQKPLHIVNMTLNLTQARNLRWQNRKAESFTASALYCGSSNMGDGSGIYRPSDKYGLNRQNDKAITLGTAAAISGAAASPNMGYFTQNAAVSFLMVLFNVRLGWWLGNPGRRGAKTWMRAAPFWSPLLFIQEAIGMTDDEKSYVYLSDGGHFDNLGLYEMVIRRCSLIVVVDAGCDADFGFSDLGKAIHKVRVDLGITIEFPEGRRPSKGVNCGTAQIRYSDVDHGANDGVLLYIKPTLDGDEPIDLKNYAVENPDFPHQSTADQMYSESQFESYRSLGFHQVDSICCRKKKCDCKNLASLEWNAQQYLNDRKGN